MVNPVELLAPAGTPDALIAALDAGADAVYLGGKSFNMRAHNSNFNFSDAQLYDAVNLAHARGKKIYVTLNNLISSDELDPLEKFLRTLNDIQPDAILVQDLAVLSLVRKLKINIPLHASVMMNTHNTAAVEMLKSFGITRVVVSRELSLAEVALLKERTGIELEYFVHGDMCIAESGQCIHSGVTFGLSGNRGRCMKPCRWAYKLVDEDSGDALDDWSHKLALNDMCMFRHIPELIHAGISSFKIEGRMRPPEFIRRIVENYRREIDSYFADPAGYVVDESRWKNLFDNRVRDFTTTFALGATSIHDIGLSGAREPKIFSRAVPEVAAVISKPIRAINVADKPQLTVRTSSLDGARAAIDSGADVVYVGGEVFKPLKPWTADELKMAINFAHAAGKKIFFAFPRTAKDIDLDRIKIPAQVDGVLVGNLGSLKRVKELNIPVRADVSFNVFNHVAADFLRGLGVEQAAASLELSDVQLRSLVENSPLPIEIIVHGAIESMLCDHDFAEMYQLDTNHHYALLDTAGEIHSMRLDQFNRWHIFFGKERCLLPYLDKINVAALRIEAQNYSPDVVAQVVKTYRDALKEVLL